MPSERTAHPEMGCALAARNCVLSKVTPAGEWFACLCFFAQCVYAAFVDSYLQSLCSSKRYGALCNAERRRRNRHSGAPHFAHWLVRRAAAEARRTARSRALQLRAHLQIRGLLSPAGARAPSRSRTPPSASPSRGSSRQPSAPSAGPPRSTSSAARCPAVSTTVSCPWRTCTAACGSGTVTCSARGSAPATRSPATATASRTSVASVCRAMSAAPATAALEAAGAFWRWGPSSPAGERAPSGRRTSPSASPSRGSSLPAPVVGRSAALHLICGALPGRKHDCVVPLVIMDGFVRVGDGGLLCTRLHCSDASAFPALTWRRRPLLPSDRGPLLESPED